MLRVDAGGIRVVVDDGMHVEAPNLRYGTVDGAQSLALPGAAPWIG